MAFGGDALPGSKGVPNLNQAVGGIMSRNENAKVFGDALLDALRPMVIHSYKQGYRDGCGVLDAFDPEGDFDDDDHRVDLSLVVKQEHDRAEAAEARAKEAEARAKEAEARVTLCGVCGETLKVDAVNGANEVRPCEACLLRAWNEGSEMALRNLLAS
jgi:hypothetical protein